MADHMESGGGRWLPSQLRTEYWASTHRVHTRGKKLGRIPMSLPTLESTQHSFPASPGWGRALNFWGNSSSTTPFWFSWASWRWQSQTEGLSDTETLGTSRKERIARGKRGYKNSNQRIYLLFSFSVLLISSLYFTCSLISYSFIINWM